MNKIVKTFEEHTDSSAFFCPTEEEILQTIFDCVDIRGINLEEYKHNFMNEESGLYDALVKLFHR
jgi:hypothetical protein